VEQNSTSQPTPKDATEPTEEQRALQEQLDDRHDDPDAPGAHNSRHDIADET